jgi:hypothetical protein
VQPLTLYQNQGGEQLARISDYFHVYFIYYSRIIYIHYSLTSFQLSIGIQRGASLFASSLMVFPVQFMSLPFLTRLHFSYFFNSSPEIEMSDKEFDAFQALSRQIYHVLVSSSHQ